MDFWYDQDTEFVQRLVEFFHLAEYWYLYIAALIIVIASTEALTRSKRGKKKVTKMKSSNFWPVAGLVAIVFLIIAGTLQIAGVGLTGKVKAPSLPSAVTQTVEEAEDRFQQHSASSQKSAPAQQRREQVRQSVEEEVEEEEVTPVPVWKDLVATFAIVLAGGLLWRFKRLLLACIAVVSILLAHLVSRHGFNSVAVAKLIFLFLVATWVYWRINQAKKNGQWLVTLDPASQRPFKFQALWWEDQTPLFLVFHLLLVLSVAFPKVMLAWGRTKWLGVWLTVALIVVGIVLPLLFKKIKGKEFLFWSRVAVGIALLSVFAPMGSLVILAVMVGLYRLSTLVQLGPAQKLTWQFNGADVYAPQFYGWARETGEDTSYRGPLLQIGGYVRSFRKGTHSSVLSVWLPSNVLKAFIFLEQVLEINTFTTPPYATVKLPWPETDKYDGADPKDLINVGESGPEVTTQINLTVYKYLDPAPYITMSEEDRMDEQQFVIRKIVEPATARFTGRMTMDQAVVAKLLKSANVRFLMDGESVTFAEYIARNLRIYGWDLKSSEVIDSDQSAAIKAAQEALKIAETVVETAMKDAEAIIERAKGEAGAIVEVAKGEGEKMLEILKPLSEALKTDPTLAVVMDYNQKMALYGGSNRIFAALPQSGQDLTSVMSVLAKALQAATGGSPVPPAPPSTPPAPPTS